MTPTEEAAKLARELAEADWPVDVYGEPASQKCAAKFMPILTAAITPLYAKLAAIEQQLSRNQQFVADQGQAIAERDAALGECREMLDSVACCPSSTITEGVKWWARHETLLAYIDALLGVKGEA